MFSLEFNMLVIKCFVTSFVLVFLFEMALVAVISCLLVTIDVMLTGVLLTAAKIFITTVISVMAVVAFGIIAFKGLEKFYGQAY